VVGEMCTKQRYPGEKEARNALKKLHLHTRHNLGKRHKHKECRTYKCETCNGWHLTSKRLQRGR
jgi:hypothetical protein